MNALLVAGLILGIGAPAPKEAPKKAQPSIVGMWETKTWTVYGTVVPNDPMLFEFTADGQLNLTVLNRARTNQYMYRLNATKVPAEIDQLRIGNETKPYKGIYQIDGDTLTLCYEDGGPDLKRPTKFESAKGSTTQLWTLKRVEKKKE